MFKTEKTVYAVTNDKKTELRFIYNKEQLDKLIKCGYIICSLDQIKNMNKFMKNNLMKNNISSIICDDNIYFLC